MITNFPLGSRFYLWNKLPMATVPGPQGRKFYDCSKEPCEILSVESLHSAREINFGEFKRLRAGVAGGAGTAPIAVSAEVKERAADQHRAAADSLVMGGSPGQPVRQTSCDRPFLYLNIFHPKVRVAT